MTLTELSYYLRRILPFFILFVLFFLIIFYSFKLYFTFLSLNKPKEPIVPRVFGNINPPEIKNSTSSANFTFVLDNIEGRPVTTTDSAKVYFLPKPTTRFGYREKIYLMAKTFGFNTEVVTHKLIDNLAVFDDGFKKLTIDISNFNFTFDNFSDKNFFTSTDEGKIIPSEKEIENKAIDFLKEVGRYPDELAKGKNQIIYLKYHPGFESYVNVDNPNEADLVEIDLYRQYPDEVPVVSPKFFNSQNYVVLRFLKNNKYQVLKAQIAFYEKSDSQFDIYPVKSGDLAWEELTKGKGYVVAATKGKKDIVIKKMYLAYYDPDFYQSFLEPVYVFLGEDDFVAYLPAIANQFLIQ